MTQYTSSKTQDSRLSTAGLVLSRHFSSRTPASVHLFSFYVMNWWRVQGVFRQWQLGHWHQQPQSAGGKLQTRWMEVLLAPVAHLSQTHQPSRVSGQLQVSSFSCKLHTESHWELNPSCFSFWGEMCHFCTLRLNCQFFNCKPFTTNSPFKWHAVSQQHTTANKLTPTCSPSSEHAENMRRPIGKICQACQL